MLHFYVDIENAPADPLELVPSPKLVCMAENGHPPISLYSIETLCSDTATEILKLTTQGSDSTAS